MPVRAAPDLPEHRPGPPEQKPGRREQRPGLREQKKARTRAAIAAAAADLFARDGYQDATMMQVAAAAGVADQTLYNYFPTKESLVFDKSGEFEWSLIEALAARAARAGLIDAFADWLDRFLLGAPARRAIRSPGGMPRLVAASDSLHRALLDVAHRMATVLAGRLRETDGLSEPAAVAVADALLAVFVRVVEQVGEARDEAGLRDIRSRAGAVLDALRPLAAVDSG
jgi:AcrR family transcriptional regulator